MVLSSSSLYKAPWARVMVYGLGHKVRRNGQLNLMEAVCYPLGRLALQHWPHAAPQPTNQYPSIIIPTDRVHIRLGMEPLRKGSETGNQSDSCYKR